MKTHASEIEAKRDYLNGPHLEKLVELADFIDNLKALISELRK